MHGLRIKVVGACHLRRHPRKILLLLPGERNSFTENDQRVPVDVRGFSHFDRAGNRIANLVVTVPKAANIIGVRGHIVDVMPDSGQTPDNIVQSLLPLVEPDQRQAQIQARQTVTRIPGEITLQALARLSILTVEILRSAQIQARQTVTRIPGEITLQALARLSILTVEILRSAQIAKNAFRTIDAKRI